MNRIQWAIDECEKPEFQQVVKDWLIERRQYLTEKEIEELESQIQKLRESLR
jgi:hypothetical protein